MMLHRAILGSLERFIALLLEHTAGALPLWLAPVQVRVLSVTDRAVDFARHVVERLEAQSVRAELDDRNEKLGYKIRAAQMLKIPVIAVIGDKEVAAQAVAPRWRGEEGRPAQPVSAFVEEVARQASPPNPEPLAPAG
jgi:threonyl-tRNA synthetase